jgi:hypothetical protein
MIVMDSCIKVLFFFFLFRIKELKRGNANNYLEASKQQELLKHLTANSLSVSDFKGLEIEHNSEDS